MKESVSSVKEVIWYHCLSYLQAKEERGGKNMSALPVASRMRFFVDGWMMVGRINYFLFFSMPGA